MKDPNTDVSQGAIAGFIVVPAVVNIFVGAVPLKIHRSVEIDFMYGSVFMILVFIPFVFHKFIVYTKRGIVKLI